MSMWSVFSPITDLFCPRRPPSRDKKPAAADIKTQSIALEILRARPQAKPLKAIIDETIDPLLKPFKPQITLPLEKIPAKEFIEGQAAKRLAHIVCDSFVQDSQLEGAAPKNTSSWLIENLEHFLPGHQVLQDLKDFNARCKEITLETLPTLSHTYTKAIKELEEGKRLLLPGGWLTITTPVRGHFILYEFVKEPGGLFTLNVYNTGNGTESFHDLQHARGKLLIRPLMSFQGMTAKELFLGDENNPRFIQMLLEMQSTDRNLDQEDNAKLLYEDILGELAPFRKPGVTAEFATPQRSGTCTYSGLIAFLRTQLSLDQFKALQLRIKMRELLISYNQVLLDDSEKGLQARYLLTKGAEWLLARLIKTYRGPDNPYFTKEELLQEVTNVRALLQDLKAEKAPLAALRFTPDLQGLHPEVFPVYQEPTPITSTHDTALPPWPKPAPIRSLDALRSALTLPLELYETETGRNHIVALIDALPSPEDLKTLEPTLSDMQLLASCNRTLYEAYCKANISHSLTFEEKLSFLKLYALQHAMALSLDKTAHLSHFKCHPQFELQPKDLFATLGFMATSHESYKKAEALINYFVTPSAPSFAIKELTKSRIVYDEKSYWELLLHGNPSLKDFFQRKLKARFPDKMSDPLYLVAMAMEFKLDDTERISFFAEQGLTHRTLLEQSSLIAANCFFTGDKSYMYVDRGAVTPIFMRNVRGGISYNADYYPSAGHFEDIFKELRVKSDEQSVCQAVTALPPLQRELFRAAVSKTASSELLIAALREKISLLDDSVNRDLFNMLFYDPTKLAAMKSDTALHTLAEHFIQEGLKTFYTESHVAIAPLTFLLEFTLKMRRLTDISFGSPDVDRLIALLQIPELDLQREGHTPVSFCAAWIRFCADVKTRTPDRTVLLNEVYTKLLAIPKPMDEKAFVEAVCKELGVPPQEVSFETLLSGHLPSFRPVGTPHFARSEEFQRIFGEGASHFNEDPQGVTFTHNRYSGTFLVNSPTTASNLGALYWEGKAYQERAALRTLLPDALLYDHNHWLTKEGELIVCDSKNNIPRYRVTKEAHIHPYDNPELVVKPLYFAHDISTIITAPEFPQYIVASYKGDELKEISYPRFQVEGKPVSFVTKEGGKFVCSFDDRYALSETKSPPFIGGLYLQNQKGGKDKILVPLLPLQKESAPSEVVKLSLTTAEPFVKFEAPFQGTIPCLTFTIDKERLQSDTNTGKLYLALLALQNKNYEEAARYIDEINRAEPLDENGKKILNFLVRHPDRNPNCAAVLMRLSSPLPQEIVDRYFAGLDKVTATLRLDASQMSHYAPLVPYETTRSFTTKPYVLKLNGSEQQEIGRLQGYHLEAFFDKHVKTASGKPLLTTISDSTWPGFFAFYRIAQGGSAIEKKMLAKQLRLYLDNPSLPLMPERKLLLKLLLVVTAGSFPPAEETPSFFQSLLGHLKKTQEIGEKQTMTSTQVEGPGLSLPVAPMARGGPLLTRGYPNLIEDAAINSLCTLPDAVSLTSAKTFQATPPSPADLIEPVLPSYKTTVENSLKDFCYDVEEGQRLLREASAYAPPNLPMLNIKCELLKQKEEELAEKILVLANKTDKPHETLELLSGYRPALSIETLYLLFLQGHAEAFQRENPNITMKDFVALRQMLFDHLLLSTTRQHVERVLASPALLAQKRAYNPLDNPEYLVFEYFSNVRLYPNQTALLEALQEKGADGNYISKVGQLMMGGGKTKVLAALLLFAAARPGHLSLFVVPSNLYNLVFADLQSAFRTNFDRLVLPLQFTKDELMQDDKLLAIESTLKRAMTYGQTVLMKPESLHLLRLQYLFLLDKAAVSGGVLSSQAEILARILTLLKDSGDALIDEAHLSLRQDEAVHIPVGSEKLAAPETVAMIGSLFEALPESLKTALQNDTQALVDLTIPFEITVPFLTREEVQSYIKGEKVPEVEAKLAANDRKYANQLALIRQTLTVLIPTAFKRSCDRHFGPLPADLAAARDLPPGKIVPYQAVGTPAATVFGTVEEEAVYGFMAACRHKISEESLTFYIKMAREHLIDTKAITNFSLLELGNPDNRAAALAYINENLKRRLAFQKEFLKFTITFYDERLSDTPQDFSLLSMRALSGTPFNRLCYAKGMGDHFIADPAVEGKIVAALLEKAPEIHVATALKSEELLRSLIKENAAAFQDAAGLFKEEDNFTVAKNFNKVLPDTYEGTLFFWQKPGMATADQLAFLRRGSSTPIPLKGSSREALLEQGINPDKVFIYYDERHTTGTDLPQRPLAVDFVTVEKEQDITETLQAILRARQFVTGEQTAEFVIPREHYEALPKTLNGLILHLVKNQSIKQADQLFHALRQRVDALFKEEALNELLTCKDNAERVDLYRRLRPLFVEKTAEDPFAAYGRTSVMTDPLVALQKHIKAKKALCPPEFNTKIAPQLAALEKTIADKKCSLPETVPATTETVHVERAVQQEVAVTVALQVDMVQELNSYQSTSPITPESPFPLADLALPIRPVSLTTSLAASMERCSAYKKPYWQCFDSNILVSPNFVQTPPLAIFAKAQKPGHQILVEKKPDGSWQFMFVTLAELDTLKKDLTRPHFWLIDDRGNPLRDQPPLPSSPAIERALLQIAAFNGNASFLLRHKEGAALWLAEEPSPLKKELLALQASNSGQLPLVMTNALLRP